MLYPAYITQKGSAGTMGNQREIYGQNPGCSVLIADDDIAIKKFVGANLIARGYQVLLAADGVEALTIFEEHPLDMIILDLLMPRLDGFEVCRQIRLRSAVPIIILSAASGEDERVQCLDMGADDFVAKPFSLQELLARIKAIHRRLQLTAPVRSSFHCGDLEINFENCSVFLNKRGVDLTATEFSILYYLALNAGKMVSYDYLLQNVWGLKNNLNNRLLWVNISRLRKKLQDNSDMETYIHSQSGQGYFFSEGSFYSQ
jgi:DNA-binding response OmpR family regulator